MKYLLLSSLLLSFSAFSSFSVSAQELNETLFNYIKNTEPKIESISEERREQLDELVEYLVEDLQKKKEVKVLAICTHNSRRSHMAQLWIETAATYYGINANNDTSGVNRISAYSGGTEATAFNQNAINALKKVGFTFEMNSFGKNTIYIVSNGIDEFNSFSKKYSHPENPKSDFVAIMVCSDADKSCPVVDGAEARFAIPYDDPRHFDDSPDKLAKYAETVEKIASEMLYTMREVKRQLDSIEEERE